MNLDFRLISRHLGLLMFVLSAVIVLVAVFAAVDRALGGTEGGQDLLALVMSAGLGVLGGGVLLLIGRDAPALIGQREALLLVAASWLLGAVLTAMPYRIWSSLRPDAQATPHHFDRFADCYFEAMSGLTTTGATVVDQLSELPRSLLLWRSVTQWLGGLGIIVLFVAVLPVLGVGGRRVFRREATGPTKEGVTPRIQDTARVLWLIYSGLTVAEILLLRGCGMGWFDATCHTFATLATGGFSTLDSSIGGFASTAIHVVIIVFMILAGVNFGLYHQLMQRQWRTVLRDRELRVYLSIIIVATLIVSLSLLRTRTSAGAGGDLADHSLAEGGTGEVEHVVRDALFQVVSMQTTTGFCTADFDTWGFIGKATLLALMFIGASAGSTGGGIKVVRIVIAAKVMLAELEHIYRPTVVRTVKIGKTAIEPEVKLATLVYLLGIAALFAAGTVGLMLLESEAGIDITTAATASAATLNNIGPGLGGVGATQNYAWFSAPSKLVMSVLMVVGRLEMFTIIVLFSPRFWRSE